MAKTLEQLQNSKAGATAESNGFGGQEQAVRPGGVYRHKENGDEIIVKTHPKFGDSQASAAERVGYEFVREASKDELHDTDLLASGDNPLVTDLEKSNSVKGLEARANDQDKLIKDLQDELAGLRASKESGDKDNDVTAESKAEAKLAAVENVVAREDNPALEDAVESVDKSETKSTAKKGK